MMHIRRCHLGACDRRSEICENSLFRSRCLRAPKRRTAGAASKDPGLQAPLASDTFFVVVSCQTPPTVGAPMFSRIRHFLHRGPEIFAHGAKCPYCPTSLGNHAVATNQCQLFKLPCIETKEKLQPVLLSRLRLQSVLTTTNVHDVRSLSQGGLQKSLRVTDKFCLNGGGLT